MGKGVHAFQEGISLIGNLVARLELELANYNVAIENVRHNATFVIRSKSMHTVNIQKENRMLGKNDVESWNLWTTQWRRRVKLEWVEEVWSRKIVEGGEGGIEKGRGEFEERWIKGRGVGVEDERGGRVERRDTGVGRGNETLRKKK